MADIEACKKIAEEALCLPNPKGTPDRYLIDRAYRVLKLCNGIAQLNDVQRFQTDHECLALAALFRDTGFARYAQRENTISLPPSSELTEEDMRDFSAQVVQEKLSELLDSRQMERLCNIILESGRRDTTLIEAMILSDACNLDDMGAVGLCSEFRRSGVQGRGITEFLKSWKRKLEYDYWSARLRESFRFDSVRQIAQNRLQNAKLVMEQLEQENRAADLDKILAQQKQVLHGPISEIPEATAKKPTESIFKKPSHTQ